MTSSCCSWYSKCSGGGRSNFALAAAAVWGRGLLSRMDCGVLVAVVLS